ncbi:hypothetical protein AB0D37_44270 [Streptomyces sp. NPDC048384]|uniref:hypothetical protein n=1 Tax=Streptomyces sp. NPDC048384 TaxID=3155487 RepID=UPI003429395B
MKKLTTRSATLAACTALLISATAGQASADATDEPSPSRLVVVKGDNNNVAGNDLHVGDNNTSGTGHTVTTPGAGVGSGDSVTVAVNVHNCSSHTLVYDFSTITGAFTRFPTSSIPPHQGACSVSSFPDASWTQQGTLFTVGDVNYGLDTAASDIDFSASIGALSPAVGNCYFDPRVNCTVTTGSGTVDFVVTDASS